MVGGHCSGAGVGEEVDQHVVRSQEEEIGVGGTQQLFTLCARGPANGLDALDAEGFDDGTDGHVGSSELAGCAFYGRIR